MVYLIFSIISSSLIYITFKFAAHFNVKIFPIIVLNYITAAIIGYLIGNQHYSVNYILDARWFYTSIILGVLFIIMFYVIGLSTKSAGITLTSISTKMSVVFPILFSIFYYSETINVFKITGILLAILSIFLSSLKGENSHLKTGKLLFPMLLFFGMGIVDSLVKFNQEEYLQNKGINESSTICFAVASIIGIIVYFYTNKKDSFKIRWNTLIVGIILGMANFGSLYFLISALNSKFTDSSIIFAINNTIIIVFTALAGKFIFKEKLILINWLGILISIIAIVSLSL